MKKTIISVAVMAAAIFAASCQKENPLENTVSEGSASVFTATIETEASTKTTVERVDGTPATYKTKWQSSDQININGEIYAATPDGTDATKATFTLEFGNEPTGPYKAYFPAEMYSGSKAILPATYTYADGKYNMPMYAESTTKSLSFKNLCGVLAITVNGTDFTSVSSIEVSSDQQMNGEFTATSEGVLTFASGALTDANKKVTLEFVFGKDIESTGSATFYIPVPAGTHNPLTIKVSNESTTKTMVTKKSGGVAIARNTVYPITFAGNAYTGELVIGDYTITDEVSLDGGYSQQTFTVISKDGTDSNISIKNLANDDDFEWYATYDKSTNTITLDGTAYGYEQYGSIFLYTLYSIGSYAAGYWAGNYGEDPIVFGVDPSTHKICNLQTDYALFAASGSDIIGYFKYYAAGVATIVKDE